MRAGRFAWRHLPHVIFFFSCASIMVVELVASRLIARHLGASLYTWSAVIGVMLAGITVGNTIGGRLADRVRPERLLPWLFVAAALACAAALGLNAAFAAVRPWRTLGWPLRILLSVVAIFILPAITLGTLSPPLGKMAVERGRRVGAALGAFYAWGTAGSIAGTFLTGFWLLFVLGNTAVILATAGALAALALASWLTGRAGEGGMPASEHPARAPQHPAGDASHLPRGGRQGGARALLDRPYAPHAVVFVASVCLMIVELLASRIVANQAGNSLYTWTSVIGVVLAGMSAGNYVGGLLSDRYDPTRFLGWLFLAASAACAGVLVLAYVFSITTPFAGWHWPAVVFGTVACLFFAPSVLLGTFSPAAAKVAVLRSPVIGTTLGSISAWNAAGSILGTLASGFWLIGALGTRSLTMLVAALLAAAGLALGPRRAVHAAWTLVALAGLTLTRLDVPVVIAWQHSGIFRPSAADVFDADSAYQHVRVYDAASEKDEARQLRVLALDYLIHGYVDLDDPGYLNYDYERIYRDVAVRYAGDKTRVSAFFLGGGSYTFPRWLMQQWPGSTPFVAEIDPLVVEANHLALGLPRDTPVRTLVGDARNVVDDLPAARQFDFFFGDAFNDLSVPYHLTTLEFTREVARHLRPDGAYLVNVIDSYESGLLLGSFVGTLRQVFRHVYVFCTERDGVTDRRDTFVVAASNVALETGGWEPRHDTDGFDGSVLTAANLRELVQKAGGRILTDDSAPVENLLAPVVRQRTADDK